MSRTHLQVMFLLHGTPHVLILGHQHRQRNFQWWPWLQIEPLGDAGPHLLLASSHDPSVIHMTECSN